MVAALCAATSLLLGAVVTVIIPPAAAADTSTKYLGIFRESSPTDIAAGTVSRYSVTPASVQWFDSWATGNAFDSAAARALWNQGIVPHFTWEPWNTALSVGDPNQIHLQDIIDGRWDSYIRARGAEFAAVGGPLMVRWGHEFNGNWYPWGIVNNNSDPALYVRAYRHVHDLVVAAGATNVQWVWCFNNGSTPDASLNDPARSYPGDQYVDWVAIDGYNWGLGPSWDPSGNHWTSFDSMFASAYDKARAIAPKRPVMISETASSEDGGNKAQWISDMSTSLQSGRYPDLKNVVYFDQDKEERWSGTSSSSAQAAFRTWVNTPFMRGTGTELAQVAAQYQGGTPPTSQPPTSQPPTSQPPTGACSATYRTVNSWSGGFQGEVTVTAGADTINGWTTRWTPSSGQTISQVWNGTLTTNGSSATVRNVEWNGSLNPRGSTTFGFIANGSSSTPAITCTSP
ncbi:cellulose binding domain-containing protein [Plantactinospora sp. ZYX-F-223]|uniref:cellulose binding domain-containing protein n=1 Tax=Plantactinospora sp. ZYX-F-223 TaxID=3144103 RepID=UPI0031FCFDDF